MTFNYKGSKVFYEETGSGQACLMLHGFLENYSYWQSIIPSLQQRYKVVSVDLPGHGSSDLPEGELSMHGMAEIVAALLQHLNIQRTTIIGHSMGGYVGLAFARAYTERVSGLILLNSSPLKDDKSRIESRKHGIKVAEKNYPAIVKMSVANLFSEEDKSILKKTIDQLKAEALQTPRAGYRAAQLAMMHRPDLSRFLKEANFKKLLILGSDDTLIDSDKLDKLFTNSSVDLKIVSGGHQLLFVNFKETTKLIQDFLKSDT